MNTFDSGISQVLTVVVVDELLFEPCCKKTLCRGFLTCSDTNRAVQLQMARGLYVHI